MIEDHFGPDLALEKAEEALADAEKEYLSCLALVRGTFRALFTVRAVPSEGACKMYLANEAKLDGLWKAYQDALKAYTEANS